MATRTKKGLFILHEQFKHGPRRLDLKELSNNNDGVWPNLGYVGVVTTNYDPMKQYLPSVMTRRMSRIDAVPQREHSIPDICPHQKEIWSPHDRNAFFFMNRKRMALVCFLCEYQTHSRFKTATVFDLFPPSHPAPLCASPFSYGDYLASVSTRVGKIPNLRVLVSKNNKRRQTLV